MTKVELSELILEKAVWMRELRAIVAPMVLVIVVASKYIFSLPFPLLPMLFIVSFVLSYNVFFMYLESSNRQMALSFGSSFASIRVFFDCLALSGLVHYTGGATSPFTYFYLFSLLGFSIATGSLIAAETLAAWAIMGYSSVLLLEKFGFLRHYPYIALDTAYLDIKVISTNIIAFVTITILFVFLVTRLVKRLEEKEINVLIKEAEVKKTRDFLDATFNAAEDLIWVIDNEGKLLDVNNRVLDLAGLEHDEAIGKHISDTFVTKEVADIIIKDAKKRERGEAIPPYEFILSTSEGKNIPFEIRASVIPGVGQVLVARDVTKSKAYEKEITEANRRLERELAEVQRLNSLIVGREEEVSKLKEEMKKIKPGN